MFDTLQERIEGMRLSLFDNTLRNRLINLPNRSSRRMLVLNGSARALRDALDSSQVLELSKDLKTEISSQLAREIVCEILEEDASLQERQGLSAIRLGLGLAAWIHPKSSKVLYAPLILKSVHLEVERDRILVRGAPIADELNDYLLFRTGVRKDDLPPDLFRTRWADAFTGFAGFEDRAVLGLFPQAGQAMAERLDTKRNAHLLTHATLRRLITLDESQQFAANQSSAYLPPSDLSPNIHAAKSDTYQDEIITLIRRGCSEILVQGPPGTGKSQTIVNIIANGIADGKTVLFMAEKMNAVAAVWARLKETEHSGPAIMLHGTGLNTADIAAKLGAPNGPDIKTMLQSCSDQDRPRAILTSPHAFALYTPPDWRFDILVVDEASQILLASAAAAVAASKQIVVCGDNQQMPPNIPISLTGDPNTGGILPMSLLSAAERVGFTSRMLKRHYRSCHPSLIDASNRLHYDTELQTVPSRLPAEKYGLHYHHIDGIYDRKSRTNLLEAKAIVEAVRAQIMEEIPRTIGIITMNEPQRDLIKALFANDGEMATFPEAAKLFLRAVPDIQGEERDIIFISLTYGRTDTGEFHQNLGPISAPHGENRVNVMMTRARYRTSIYGAFEATTLPVTGRRGVESLRFYLHAAQTGHLTLAGKPCDGPLARALLNEKYTITRFRRALLVGNYRRFRRDPVEFIGMIYLTGTVNVLDEESEKQQLRDARWKITDFPYELMHEMWVTRRPEFKELLYALKNMCSYDVKDWYLEHDFWPSQN